MIRSTRTLRLANNHLLDLPAHLRAASEAGPFSRQRICPDFLLTLFLFHPGNGRLDKKSATKQQLASSKSCSFDDNDPLPPWRSTAVSARSQHDRPPFFFIKLSYLFSRANDLSALVTHLYGPKRRPIARICFPFLFFRSEFSM